MQTSEKTKKILNIISKTTTYLLLAFALFIMVFTIITVSTVDKNDRSFFGRKWFIVQSDSMSKSDKNAHLDVHFNAGDIILVREAESNTAFEVGDIIAFISSNSDSRGKTITHMIHSVEKDSNGKVIGYKTYGTNTGTVDEETVEPEYILGEYTGKIPALGNFFAFLKTTKGYIFCIFLPFALLIGYNAVKCVKLFSRYKKEQRDEMQAEKDSIAEERKKNEEMMKELLALKEQLEKQASVQNQPPKTDGEN